MCGIAGLFDPHGNNGSETLHSMTARLTHRGPDDEGYFEEGPVSLGMRRLSIIDLAGGHQPLYNEDQSLVLVYNGEIFNYRELRQSLTAAGHWFASASDGEVILHLYEDKGLGSLADLNGMYAFCLWDRKRKEGLLVRDRLGIKPLYYSISPSGRLAFSSEIKALLADRTISQKPDFEALLLALGCLFTPWPKTPFHSVRKLPPAHLLRFGGLHSSSPERYWKLPEQDPWDDDPSRFKREFLDLARSAIEFQSRSDVPVGVFLSGGLDSSLITRLFIERSSAPVHSFSVSYAGSSVDESAEAAEMAKVLGCQHHTVTVSWRDVVRLLPKLIFHMDEPLADSALVAGYMVSELAAKEVKVVLNGTGGDELLGGYDRYRENAWPLRAWHRMGPSLQNAVLGMAGPFCSQELMEKVKHNRNQDDTYLWRLMPLKPFHLHNFFAGENTSSDVRKALGVVWPTSAVSAPERWMRVDLESYLVDDLLLLLDKMTMATSIEGRVPLLDHRLVEWAARIPSSWKIRHGKTKFGMRTWLKDLLPRDVLQRPKRGFGAPVSSWMAAGLERSAHRLISERPSSRGCYFWGLRGSRLSEQLRKLNSQQVFALLVMEIWARLFVERESPEEISERISKG